MIEDVLRQAGLTVFTAASLLRRLMASTWVQSVDLTVEVPSGSTSVSALHGLGRSYNGAVIVGASEVSTATVAIAPDAAATHVVLFFDPATAFDMTIKLRVY